MDVGETVVVGTSRLKGGSKALIALLTAVPPRGAEHARVELIGCIPDGLGRG